MSQSERVKPGTLPKMAKCIECHDGDQKNCAMCHVDPAKPRTWEPVRTPSVVFPHASHSDQACSKCHAGIEAKGSTKATARPLSHELCMACHRSEFREIDCRKCHEDLVDNPSRPLNVFSHDAAFMKRHGTLARGDEAVCSHCHRENECASCHSRLDVLPPGLRQSEKVERNLVHRGDFVTRHAIESRADPSSCLRCHKTSQCDSCHRASRVAAGATGAVSSHPAGWMSPASPSFHGRSARTDIASCAACHDRGAASNCVACHKVGAAGGSPHPAGWKPSQGKDSPACRACH